MSDTFEVLDAAPAITSTLTASISKVQGEVAAFDKVAAGLAAIQAAHPKGLVLDVSTTAGMKQAIAARAAWRDPRIAVEKARKAAKAPVLELGKQIDSFAASLEATLREGEDNYDSQIKAEEARKEAERIAKAEAERARVQDIQARINGIRSAVGSAVGMTFSGISQLLSETGEMVIGAEFEEFQGQAQTAKEETLDKLREMQSAALAREAEEARIKAEREAEAARLAAERTELERLRAEAAERERIAAAARAEQERKDREAREAAEREQAAKLAAERAAQAEELRKQREAQEAELRAQREAQAKAEAEAAAARRAEESRLAAERAELRRKQDEAAAAQRAAEEAAHAADMQIRNAAHNMLAALREISTQTNAQKAREIALQAISDATGA